MLRRGSERTEYLSIHTLNRKEIAMSFQGIEPGEMASFMVTSEPQRWKSGPMVEHLCICLGEKWQGCQLHQWPWSIKPNKAAAKERNSALFKTLGSWLNLQTWLGQKQNFSPCLVSPFNLHFPANHAINTITKLSENGMRAMIIKALKETIPCSPPSQGYGMKWYFGTTLEEIFYAVTMAGPTAGQLPQPSLQQTLVVFALFLTFDLSSTLANQPQLQQTKQHVNLLGKEISILSQMKQEWEIY